MDCCKFQTQIFYTNSIELVLWSKKKNKQKYGCPKRRNVLGSNCRFKLQSLFLDVSPPRIYHGSHLLHEWSMSCKDIDTDSRQCNRCVPPIQRPNTHNRQFITKFKLHPVLMSTTMGGMHMHRIIRTQSVAVNSVAMALWRSVTKETNCQLGKAAVVSKTIFLSQGLWRTVKVLTFVPGYEMPWSGEQRR